MTTPNLQQLIPAALSVVNSLGVENATLGLSSGPQGLRVQVEFRDVTLRAGRLDGVALDEGRIWIEDLIRPRILRPWGDRPDSRGAPLIRVSANLVNRLLESEFFRQSCGGARLWRFATWSCCSPESG